MLEASSADVDEIVGLYDPDSFAPGEIRREANADLANKISNDSDILNAISRHGGSLDWTPAVGGGLILSNGVDAVMVFEQTDFGDWQVETLYADTCRGKRALETGLAMKAWLLENRRVNMVFGAVPNTLRHAMWFYRKLGGVKAESVESGGFIHYAQPDETFFVMRTA